MHLISLGELDPSRIRLLMTSALGRPRLLLPPGVSPPLVLGVPESWRSRSDGGVGVAAESSWCRMCCI